MVLLLFLLVMLASPAAANPALCEGAARQAAAESGVPADLMLAIATVETRRSGSDRPWPWTANLDGRGHWFDSRIELAAFVESVVAAGQWNVDIGCFQINWRWHGQHFAYPSDLVDPLTNARHAARFLAQLHDELGDWAAAVGAYHSRNPGRAAAYGARVAAIRMSDPPPLPTLAPAPPAALRPDAWPLPPAGPPGALASLFPASAAPRPFLLSAAP